MNSSHAKASTHSPDRLAAFEAAEAARIIIVREHALSPFMSKEQAAAIVKALSGVSDVEFSAVVTSYATTHIKPIEKAVEVVEPVDHTRAILEAKYGKK
ncbi:hypothetical protein D3C76_1546120 [compost metagenome]